MNNKMIFIDFDGVIFNTEELIINKKNQNASISWDDFFRKLDWFQLMKEASIINNAIEYILQSQETSQKIAILTKIHTLIEMEAKVNILRKYNVNVPILFVPPHIKKSQVYPPKQDDILIDDSIKNLVDWNQNGGRSIYFSEKHDNSSQFETICTLSRVLRSELC